MNLSFSKISRSLALAFASLAAFSGALFAADAVVKVGAVLPVTGKESKIGGAYKQATEFAIKEVNDAGGVKIAGKPMKIELTLLDDTSDAAKSAQLVEQLITQQKVEAVIGGYGSHLVQAQVAQPRLGMCGVVEQREPREGHRLSDHNGQIGRRSVVEGQPFDTLSARANMTPTPTGGC